MRFRMIFLLAAVLAPFSGVLGQTSVTEDILADATWSADAGPYRITRDISVSNGATLTLSPGTVVEFGFSGTVFVGNGARVIADSVEFRPIHTRGLDAAILQFEGSAAGHVEIRRSSIDNLYLYNSGRGDFVVENTRFTGEGHLRLYGRAPIRVTHCTFAGEYPIHTKIDLPKSDITDNHFASNAVVFHPGAERIVRDDTIRTYGNLPVSFDNNISVSKGARLTVLPGTEIRLGYFDSFLVNGGATLEVTGTRIRPADGSRRFPAVIVSLGDGAAHAEITDSILEDVYLEFSGGTGVVERTDFVVMAGHPALVNTGSTAIVATGNFWDGEQGPFHVSNPTGDGATVSGFVEFAPWSSRPHASKATWTEQEISGTFRLDAPYPNPASDVVAFSYEAPSASNIRWEMFDALGRSVRQSDGSSLPPSGRVIIDVSPFPPGIYFLQLTAGAHAKTWKIVVIR